MGAQIDLDQLRLMTGGDAELAAEALGIFRSQADIWGRLLDRNGEVSAWADACHAIKGAARSVGAMSLGDACEKAERLGRKGEASRLEAAVAVSEVKDRLGEALEAIAHIQHHLASRRSFEGVRAA